MRIRICVRPLGSDWILEVLLFFYFQIKLYEDKFGWIIESTNFKNAHLAK